MPPLGKATQVEAHATLHYVQLQVVTGEQYLKSALVRGVKIWEMLPSEVQKATTKVKFKAYMKQICRY